MNKALVVTIISFAIVCIFSVFLTDKTFLKEFYFTFVSIVTGVIIAVVGIFLGSISILINNFTSQLRSKKLERATYDLIVGKLKDCKKEIKDNLIAIIILYLIGSFLFLLQKVDIPGVA